jgi:PEP-CTERM motif
MVQTIMRFCLLLGIFLGAGAGLQASLLVQGFDDVLTLPAAGWLQTNNSTSGGSTGWFQGVPAPTEFDAQSGAANSYIGANFNNAGFGGDISNWLITPVVTLDDGETFSFYTTTDTSLIAPDHLEIRMSTNGSSSDVGATPTSVGDFSALLQSINPTLDPNGYPTTWTQFQITLSGLGGSTSGRLAFRYFVPDTSVNANYIGIDTVALDAAVLATPEPATASLLLIALMAGAAYYLRKRRITA